jgi:hypothetical protein
MGRFSISLIFISLFYFLMTNQVAEAADVPGGLIRNAEGMPSKTFEVVLSPGFIIDPGGAYLGSEVRYQAGEDVGLAFGFGSGEIGFNFGANGTWYILPDIAGQPALSILGGLYFNRVVANNYFVLRFTPTISKSYKVDEAKLTPYAGVNLSPSFRLGSAQNEFSVKTSTGIEVAASALNGINLWAEVGIGIFQSYNELVFGLSYPFKSI